MDSGVSVGFLAHVDAGKTTLTEGILYNSGAIRKLGRVDHQDAFLDNDPMERDRGITIFSKQARIKTSKRSYTLVDTPGHGELSPETERVLGVLDYCVLLISADDKVTGHVRLLWKMLEQYNVPVFVFVNKMDRPDADRDTLFEELKSELSILCVDFCMDPESDEFQEQIALADEELLEGFLEGEKTDPDVIAHLIRERKVFPVLFGSALKNKGIDDLMKCMDQYMIPAEYGKEFGARVYKISRDAKGARLAWLKVTGGTLKVKMPVSYEKDGAAFSEKIEQIRLYSGHSSENVPEAQGGTICAVTGLSSICAGDCLGVEKPSQMHIVEPVMTYEIVHDTGIDTVKVIEALRTLEEEEPMLHVSFSEETGKISVRVMGRVQMEVLQRQMRERFGMDIDFGHQTVIYKETISNTVEGAGHFEPLRHYAEVHVLLEPLPRGSGVLYENRCHRDYLDPHWQRLIMTHFKERSHRGVLTGSEITDIKISLVSGRAHEKHTEPGDFRQASYRAVRQGLMEAVSILLEPYFDFVLNVPEEMTGRALYDLDRRGAKIEAPDVMNGTAVIKGSAPAAGIGGYQEKVTVYTSGRGRLFCTFAGYEECHNAQEIIEAFAYDPDKDLLYPSSSVFCSHGAGVIVPWYNAKDRMHVEMIAEKTPHDADAAGVSEVKRSVKEKKLSPEEEYKENARKRYAAENELKEIFNRTYGSKGEPASRPGWKDRGRKKELFSDPASYKPKKQKPKGKEYLLVDGYNIIFAWEELASLAKNDIGAARDKLMDVLSDHHGTRNGELILVFDAYKVPGGTREVYKYHNIYVVFTKESETADQYIEKTVHEIARDHNVTVATSDGLEQMIILGEGAVRMSAAGLFEAVAAGRKQIKEEYLGENISGRSKIGDIISQEVKDSIDDRKRKIHEGSASSGPKSC